MLNALSVDLEEWYCSTTFERAIDRDQWKNLESRIRAPTEQILDLFDQYDAKATFFVLGWVAAQNPGLIHRILQRGHELASHGYGHELVYQLTPEAFASDLKKSLGLIEEITGVRCRGYRAPTFSLRRDMAWAWDILQSEGIEYDSSIFPIMHDRYGEPDAPRWPFIVNGQMQEFPMSTVSFLGRNIPVAGGGYLRLYPYWMTRRAIRNLNQHKRPAVIYFHPWELDPDQPFPRVSAISTFRQRVGIRGMKSKLEKLLRDFSFAPLEVVLQQYARPDKGENGNCELISSKGRLLR